MAKHAAAQNLMDRIIVNDVSKVDEFLGLGDSLLWRQLIRYEFEIESFQNPALCNMPLLPKLQAYEIKTLSSFNLTALLGATDILMSLMEKDVPVDITSCTGTTALHMAAFSGKTDLVRLLIEVYKADIHRTDKYGWSALHYACTEGHLDIVEILIEHGIDVSKRDQDGTTPAFRAQINGHEDIVQYLLLNGSDEDQLNISETAEATVTPANVADLYAKVNKIPKPTVLENEFDNSSSLQGLSNGNRVELRSKASDMFVSVPGDLNRSVSDDSMRSGYSSAPRPKRGSNRLSVGGISGSQTLPSKHMTSPVQFPEAKESIRRLIRKELEMSFGSESGYERPASAIAGRMSTTWDEELKDIGVKTLTGLMREEFEKYKQQQQLEQIPSEYPLPPMKNGDDSQYEDLYTSIANLPPPPSPPLSLEEPLDAPPLPPRNLRKDSRSGLQQIEYIAGGRDQLDHGLFTLESQHSTNPALTKSFELLAPLLGKNWKKLARALPLATKTSKTNERISAIEKQGSGSLSDQALRALTEWRVQKGKEANVDALIIALRKCNLHSAIPEVEKATQEFTA